MEDKISNICLTVVDNGGYQVSFEHSYKPEMSGQYDNCRCDWKKEAFGPKDSAKAFARVEELKAMTAEKED